MTAETSDDKLSILLVEDDDVFRLVLARSLRARGYDVQVAAGYEEAVDVAVARPPRLALVDLRMPGRSGFDLIEAIKRIHSPTVVVVLSADRSDASRREARKRGAAVYLTKPADIDDIVATLNHAVENSEKGQARPRVE